MGLLLVDDCSFNMISVGAIGFFCRWRIPNLKSVYITLGFTVDVKEEFMHLDSCGTVLCLFDSMQSH